MRKSHDGFIPDEPFTLPKHALLAVLTYQGVWVGLVRLVRRHTRYHDLSWPSVLMDLKPVFKGVLFTLNVIV